MKTFIILQRIVLFRVDWRTLVDRSHYRLILITHQQTINKLADDQRLCFDEIHSLEEFSKENIVHVIKAIKQHTDNKIEIVTNDELCIALAAELREFFALPGDSVAQITRFINKQETKCLLKNTNIALPKYETFSPLKYKNTPQQYLIALAEKLAFPIFAKPTNSAASQHTAKLNNSAELEQWCELHKDENHYELDEFITGTLFHCESIIRNNEIIYVQVGENAYPCFDFMSGKITGSISISKGDPLIDELLQLNHQALMALRPLPNCVTHVELFRKPNGDLVFLEIACRAPGGMIVQMHEKHCGINFEQAHFAMQMNLPFEIKTKQGPHCAWAWFPMKEGTVKELKPPAVESHHKIQWKIAPQQMNHKATSLIDYAGSIILTNNDYAQLRKDFIYLAESDSPIITSNP